MYVGVIFDEKTNMVADYAPEATMMEYTICDGGYKPNGTKWLPNAYISMHFVEEMGKEEKYHQRIAALICGAIGDGAARALEDYGVKIFRNVTGDVESVFEDYKNNKLEEGENTKLPPRQNLFEYWRAQQDSRNSIRFIMRRDWRCLDLLCPRKISPGYTTSASQRSQDGRCFLI